MKDLIGAFVTIATIIAVIGLAYHLAAGVLTLGHEWQPILWWGGAVAMCGFGSVLFEAPGMMEEVRDRSSR